MGAFRQLWRRLVRKFRRAPNIVYYQWRPRIMSALRKWLILITNPDANIVFEGPVFLGPGFSLDIAPNCSFIVGPYVHFRRNFHAELSSGGRITIGEGSYFTYDVVLSCSTTIDIGERCGFGQSLYLTDGSHRFTDLDKPLQEQGYKFRPLVIEDDVSVFSKVTIVNNIGRKSVIGSNAMVSRPIPAYTVAAGVPAEPFGWFGPGEKPPELAHLPTLNDRIDDDPSTGETDEPLAS